MAFDPFPFSLPGAQSILLPGHVPGEAYRIDIALPGGEAPDQGWPSVLLLDAGGCFATTVEAMRRMSRRRDATGVGEAVIIGLSPAREDKDTARRQRDFTASGAGAEGIGAAGFLDFIEHGLFPAVEAFAPVDPRRRTLFGHSLAGYFALWVLAHRPAVFRAYAAVSPSIWWDREGLFEALGKAALGDRRLFLTVGQWEEALPPWQQGLPGSEEALARRRSRRMIANVRELGAVLKAVMGAGNVHQAVLPEEDHASIISAAIPRMLRLASQEEA